MTQLGRYASIIKQPLSSYALVQDNLYHLGGNTADCTPVDTQVHIEFDETVEDAQRLVSMGEQTCFLHAALRTSTPTNIAIKTQGQIIKL